MTPDADTLATAQESTVEREALLAEVAATRRALDAALSALANVRDAATALLSFLPPGEKVPATCASGPLLTLAGLASAGLDAANAP